MKSSLHRRTNQKDFVYKFLFSTYTHPTAYDVQKAAEQNGIRIGLTSIYRILNGLVQDGKALTIVEPDGIVHYDFIRNDHYHFVCRQCGKIIDLKSDEAEMKKILDDQHLSSACLQGVTIYGVCPDCLAKATKERKQ
jgi:Fur family transcriptional regulator, peroxide stress response regulator